MSEDAKKVLDKIAEHILALGEDERQQVAAYAEGAAAIAIARDKKEAQKRN